MEEIRQHKNSLIWRKGREVVQIEPWGKDSLRVRAAVAPEIREDLPGALVPPESTDIQIDIDGTRGIIRNGALAAEIALQHDFVRPGKQAGLRFFNAETGAEILSEAPAFFPRPAARQYTSAGGELYRMEVRFKAYDDERIYGLGQHQHGRLNQKGCVIDQLQYNTEACIPFLVSNRGYGFLWNNPAIGRVEFSQDITRWIAEATPQLDYWITVGQTPGDIIENYSDVTGHAPMLPDWAAGFWQCKLRYRTQEELLDVAREYKRRGLPLEVIVSDFFHWSKQGDWQFDPEFWPDPAAMVRELEEMGVKLMVSIWPSIHANSVNFREMQERGLLISTERGVPALMPFRDVGEVGAAYIHYYDATHPEARKFIWERVREGYYQHGIKVWWLDACEPEIVPRHFENLRYYLGNGLAVANIYPLLHEQGFYEGMRAEGEEEIISLCRSVWAGSQRYGAALWSGDIASTFEALQAQLRAGLNAGLSGIPWWTTDIGGFHGGDITTPYFRELIVRWFQYGVFCPLFRLHGFRLPNDEMLDSGGDNEVWSFGDEAYRIIKELMFLRERLRPYIMEQMQLAHKKGTPPMRPLFFDFPEDETSWTVDDQFMFGPDLLVAPVLYEGARNRDVYLPSGASWTDAWTNEVLDGGQHIAADAPLDRIPLYLRNGKRLPIIGEKQH